MRHFLRDSPLTLYLCGTLRYYHFWENFNSSWSIPSGPFGWHFTDLIGCEKKNWSFPELNRYGNSIRYLTNFVYFHIHISKNRFERFDQLSCDRLTEWHNYMVRVMRCVQIVDSRIHKKIKINFLYCHHNTLSHLNVFHIGKYLNFSIPSSVYEIIRKWEKLDLSIITTSIWFSWQKLF